MLIPLDLRITSVCLFKQGFSSLQTIFVTFATILVFVTFNRVKDLKGNSVKI
jgi:hypothetical protein